MTVTPTTLKSSFARIPIRKTWNNQLADELLMHRIHVYPAKFPSFLISKALHYAARHGVEVKTIGDIFCGCGTTALEARRKNKDFWGCDINPVATLITRVKRDNFDETTINQIFERIISHYSIAQYTVPRRIIKNERIRYWFKLDQICNLYHLLMAIKKSTREGKYRNFFLVAFSNILKRTSLWLTKSIKPTKAKVKFHHPVLKTFKAQCRMMLKATREVNGNVVGKQRTIIRNANFLSLRPKKPFLDLLITSPPYVTSYEYADLHQLSALWLGYTSDYKSLRKGSIGSGLFPTIRKDEEEQLDSEAIGIYESMLRRHVRGPRSALKYFIDMKKTINKSFSIVNPGGIAIFVIGNTSYKGVYVDNAKYLAKCMIQTGFQRVDVFKRKISSKILTPYRDKTGKFSSNKKHRKVYGYEFVVTGRKPIASR